MILKLSALRASAVMGIYTIKGVADQLRDDMRFLAPDAAASYRANLASSLVLSDMFRTGAGSLQAVREGRGAMPPGFSGHNFGLSIDVDLGTTMKRMGMKSKADFDAWMENWGWFCHRRDHHMDFEAWHFNYLGRVTISPTVKTTAGYLEMEIQHRYGLELAPDDEACQRMLTDLGLYHGEIDGDIGPLSTTAIRAFERCWGREETGRLDARTRRTLAYVTASRFLS